MKDKFKVVLIVDLSCMSDIVDFLQPLNHNKYRVKNIEEILKNNEKGVDKK